MERLASMVSPYVVSGFNDVCSEHTFAVSRTVMIAILAAAPARVRRAWAVVIVFGRHCGKVSSYAGVAMIWSRRPRGYTITY